MYITYLKTFSLSVLLITCVLEVFASQQTLYGGLFVVTVTNSNQIC